MTATPRAPAPAAAVASSSRVQLARIAWKAGLATEGVVGGDAGGGRWQTEDQGQILRGVLVATRGDGRFDVELHLVAGWPTPPLHEVARVIRDRIIAACAQAGLAEALGHVAISFGDLVESPEATS